MKTFTTLMLVLLVLLVMQRSKPTIVVIYPQVQAEQPQQDEDTEPYVQTGRT